MTGVGGGRSGFWGWRGCEVAACDLEDVGEESGSLEVHAVVGEQGGEIAEGLLDGGVVVEVGDVERLVFDDGRNDGVAMGEAHEVVVHGAGAAAAAVFVVVVHALVRDGWFAAEVVVAVVQHGVAPPGCLVWFR
ncbi:MAG TPA: hypothetical protein VHU44_15335 [Acidobacteriaceae bacterium]|jgi:hypothetical protein|nr:hypothetical protein [Acidobacteriaceae bacterium]